MSKGVPQDAQNGSSMKEIALQHAAQSECGSPTRARQDTHKGGNNALSTADVPRRASVPVEAVISLVSVIAVILAQNERRSSPHFRCFGLSHTAPARGAWEW